MRRGGQAMSESPEGEAVRPSRSARHRVERSRARAAYDAASVHAILDAGMIAHVGFVVDAQPFVIPMLYARDGASLVLHGSIASRLVGQLGAGVDACVSVTLVDALVLARSHFHHSVNYRSVVAFGRARVLADAAAKAAALARFVDAMIPGRAAEARPADRNELAATAVLHFAIEDASAKLRSGGVKDDSADLDLPHWAGVVPLQTRFGRPVLVEPALAGQPLPASVQALLARNGEPE
jgi:nitroimidazol reductase NimA-like FMN-containing flavoprotein (pyridoxamine 5'-phosphate oxidase superfamily)